MCLGPWTGLTPDFPKGRLARKRVAHCSLDCSLFMFFKRTGSVCSWPQVSSRSSTRTRTSLTPPPTRQRTHAHDAVARNTVARQFRGVCMRSCYPERLVHRDCHNTSGATSSSPTRTPPPPIRPPCERPCLRQCRCAPRVIPWSRACDSTLYQLLSHTQIARGVLDLGIDTLAAKKDKSRHDLSFLAAKLEILMVHDPSMTEGSFRHGFEFCTEWCRPSCSTWKF